MGRTERLCVPGSLSRRAVCERGTSSEQRSGSALLRMSVPGGFRGGWESRPRPGPPGRGPGVGAGRVRAAGDRTGQGRARLPVGGASRPRNARPSLTSAPRLLGLPLWTRRQSRSAPRRFAPAPARRGLGSGSRGGGAPPAPGPGAGGGAPWPAPRLSSWRSPSSSAHPRPRLRQVSARRSDPVCPAEPRRRWRISKESGSVG